MSIQDNNNAQGYTAPGAATGYDPVTGTPYDPAGAPPPPQPPYGYPPPPAPGSPNPMLAGLLGFIPGVGAMYNGQFAKGIAHIAIFAVFVSLANHVSGIFALLVAGWIFYMVFEAYQTAAARRDGQPLPDPFGLNNIGERFGFHSSSSADLNRAWSQTMGRMPGAAPVMEESRYDAATGATYYTRTESTGTSTYHVDPQGNVTGAQGWNTPPVPPVEPPPAYQRPFDPAQPPYGSPYGVPPVPPVPPPAGYGVPPVPPVPGMPPARCNTLPIGAIWLIGLGVLVLLGSWHPFSFLAGEAMGGFFLIALAAFLFVRRYMTLRQVFPEGSPVRPWENPGSYKGPVILFVVGLLTVLDNLHVVEWDRSWPLLLIAIGGVMLAERAMQNRLIQNVPYPPYSGDPAAYAPPAPAKDEPVSFVPRSTHMEDDLSRNDEGRNEQEGR